MLPPASVRARSSILRSVAVHKQRLCRRRRRDDERGACKSCMRLQNLRISPPVGPPPPTTMDSKKCASFVTREWNENVVPSLMDFVRIPNVSPAFDAEWDTNGLQNDAFDLVTKWAEAQKIPNCKIELLKEVGRTPLLIMEVEAHESEQACMLYAHIDKQPPMGVWMEGLGPYELSLIHI